MSQREMVITLDPEPRLDDGDRRELTRRLRSALLDLDVDSVELAAGGPAPEGAKSADLVSVGELVVVLGAQRYLLRAVVDTTAAWLARQQARGVKLTIDGNTLELSGVPSRELRELVERWLDRHTPAE